MCEKSADKYHAHF